MNTLSTTHHMKNLIGAIPEESGFISKYRQHQGWWRTFVLAEKEGRYFDTKHKEWKTVCNRINNGETDAEKKNFLSKEIAKQVEHSLILQEETGSGIMERERLYNNLLSSQPLAFNFFGFFNANPDIAVDFLRTIRPDVIQCETVFEYAPKSGDNSAFDFGFKVKTESKTGFIGFECKYTDTFSAKRPKTHVFYGDLEDKNYRDYYKIFCENRNRFQDDYFTYVRSCDYNQLFRNELLAMQIKPKPDFIITGLFCLQSDTTTVKAGLDFQKKVGNGEDEFILLTYADYFERIQKLNLTWEMRELIMMLWARYCGLGLSKNILKDE